MLVQHLFVTSTIASVGSTLFCQGHHSKCGLNADISDTQIQLWIQHWYVRGTVATVSSTLFY